MSDFASFVTSAATQLGVSPDKAGTAAGGLLGLITDRLPDSDASALMQKLPGAASFLGASGAGESGGGGLGGLLGAASGLFGGKGGAAAGLLGALTKSGLNPNQLGEFVPLFMNFVKSQAGADMVAKILQHVPDLKALMG